MKLKRYFIVWIGVSLMLLTVLLTLFTTMADDGMVWDYQFLFEQVVKHFVTMIFPMCITLISGYMISREYTDDTLKNIETLPISFRKLLAGKLIVSAILSLFLGIVCFVFTVIANFIMGYDGFALIPALTGLVQMALLGFFLYLTMLPIIVLTSRYKGSFLVGVIVAFVYGFIRTKKMVADPIAADHVRLMFQMYAEPETSFGDITRYFEEQGIKIYEKSMVRSFLSQLLRNPVYAQADLELYEFFKSQGAAIVNDASDFAGTNGCYLYQGRDVKEDKDRCLKDQILVIAPHEALISSDTWLKCRKKLMANTTFQQGRKPKNTWLAGKIKCGHCGYALKATHVPNSTGYFRCTKRTENKGCPGCGKIRKEEFEQFIFSAMQEKFKDFQILHGREEKVNPKLTAYQVELAQVEAEIEKLLDTLTGANATLLAYANKKIEELDTRRQTISKAIAELSVETISPQQIKKLSYYLDNWDSIDFDDKRKAADGLISTIKATSDRVQIEWKI